jgi:hypothetical protein
MHNSVAALQMRRDGWTFLRSGEEAEIRAYDAARNRRVAEDPQYDLTAQLHRRPMSRILGFDDRNNLYAFAEGYPRILRWSPRNPSPVSPSLY